MSKLPPINATLTRVQAAGFSEDGPAPPGEILWEGTAPAYLTEKVLVATSPEGLDIASVTRLVIEADVPGVGIGVLVTYEHGVTATRQIRDIERHPDRGYVRLFLQDN